MDELAQAMEEAEQAMEQKRQMEEQAMERKRQIEEEKRQVEEQERRVRQRTEQAGQLLRETVLDTILSTAEDPGARAEMEKKLNRCEIDILTGLVKKMKGKDKEARLEVVLEALIDVDPTIEELARGLEREFVDPQNTLGKLLQTLDAMVAEVFEDHDKVAAITVVQSSGVGKTRSLLELSHRDVFVCYCSLQSKSGYPLRTPGLADTLLNADDQGVCMGYLRAWLICIKGYLDGSLHIPAPPSSSSSAPLSSTGLWTMNQVMKRENQVSEVLDAVKDTLRRQPMCTEDELNDALQGLLPSLPRRHDRKLGVLFVFDEASCLFTGLQRPTPGLYLRRALGTFFSSALGTFVDTSAKLSILSPIKELDPSYRIREGLKSLLRPLWQIGVMDVLAPNFATFKTLEDLSSPNIWKFGRPLWATTSHPFSLALRKLCGGISKDSIELMKYGQKVDESTAMAVLGARLALDVQSYSELATNLVANHMSLVLDISSDRRCLVIADPWDPVVTEAAKTLLVSDPFRHAALEFLEKCTAGSLIDEGKNGELVARYVLMRAMDVAMAKSQSVDHVSVCNFLEQLLGEMEILTARGESKVVRDWLGPKLAAGVVNFSGFVIAMDYTPSLDDLLIAFIMRKAFICKPCQQRFDIIIPTLLPTLLPADDNGDKFIVSRECISFAAGQVKSIYGNVDMTFNASTYMNPIAAGVVQKEEGFELPFVTFSMQLGADLSYKKYIPSTTRATRRTPSLPTSQKAFVVYGLSREMYPCLTVEEERILRNMVFRRRNPVKSLYDWEFARAIIPYNIKGQR